MSPALESKPIDRSFWEFWATAEQRDEQEFRKAVLGLVARAQQCAFHDDWAGMRDSERLYRLGESLCTEEPFLSAYQFGQMLIGVILADFKAGEGDYLGVHQEIGKVFATLNSLEARRAALGLEPRENNQVRYNSLGALANAKWLGPEALRDEVLTPTEILERFETVAMRVFTKLRTDEQLANAPNRHITDAVALAGIEVCKLAARYCPERLAERVEIFNKRHHEQLTLQIGHYRSAEHYHERSAFFWDFELAKLFLSGQQTTEDIHVCMELRAAAAPRTFGSWPLGGLYRRWRTQAMRMLAAVKKQ